MKTFQQLFATLTFSLFLFTSLWSNGCIDATVYAGEGSNTMYAFRGNEVSVFDWNTNNFGTPVAIANLFPGLPFSYVDAAFETIDALWLISGDQMAKVDKNSLTAVSTQPLSTYFPDLPADWISEGIDAAICRPWSSVIADLFIFKGNQSAWMEINVSTAIATGNEVQIPYSQNWAGLFSDHFPGGIDAAVYRTGYPGVYFQKGNSYVKIDGSTISSNYPASYVGNWYNFPSIWSCVDNLENGDCSIGYQLPDNGCSDASTLDFQVDNAPGTALGSDVLLNRVAIYIEHTYVSDLTISLTSPSGKEVLLTNAAGGSGSNYGNGCNMPTFFVMDASTSIANASAPFTGGFIPLGDFAEFEDGTNPNGIWEIKICDVADVDVGILQHVELLFETPTVTATEEVTEIDFDISLSPNPASTFVHLEYEHSSNKSWLLEVYSSTGQQMSQFTVSGDANISVTDWSAGLYFYRLIDEHGGLKGSAHFIVKH